MSAKPIIPQSDFTLMLRVDEPDFPSAREFVSKFSVAVKTPEHIHIYKIDAVSLWNASVLGYDSQWILEGLARFSDFDTPRNVEFFIREQIARYGSVVFVPDSELFFLMKIREAHIEREVANLRGFDEFVEEKIVAGTYRIGKKFRGKLKAYLIELGFPVEDRIGFLPGEPLEISLTEGWGMRGYQKDAVEAFWQGGNDTGGSGVVVLACGGGKTIVAIGVLEKAQTKTLIITTTANAAFQFKHEILARTSLREDQVGIYSAHDRQVRDITITTYSMLTYRENETKEFKYLDIFESANWGLIVYDEVHVLPAPVFSFSTSLQAKRRLGLTATLVREDGKEPMIFGLIGPKRFDMPWKELESVGFIATVSCTERRVPMDEATQAEYYAADSKRLRFKIAATSPEKANEVLRLIDIHSEDRILIIGEYLEQLEHIQKMTDIPMITGKLSPEKRELLFEKFRKGEIQRLLLSRVANFAIDLPDANVLIQVSGLYGSRQEEAQRLGRILRPKAGKNEGNFYNLVTDRSVEIEFAEKRQLFLIEQGYHYNIT
jgi:DNA excision repair protein ERCC-3